MAAPLEDSEFSALLKPLAPPERLAAAVSGGPDSLALLVLLARWRDSQTRRETALYALSVDHALRPDAAAEVRHAARIARRLDIPHLILRRRGPKPSSAIQAAARNARHALMQQWCRRNAVTALAFAHHLEDQAETFLFRLARGSQLDGLAAMTPETRRGSVRILRPLLAVPKTRLAARLTREKIAWRNDPSNHDPAFTRTHLARALTALEKAAMPPARLAAAAKGARRLRRMLDAQTAAVLQNTFYFDQAGFAATSRNALRGPYPVALRALRRALMTVGARRLPPATAKLTNLLDALRAQAPFPGCTLAGCRLIPAQGKLMIVREAGWLARYGAPLALRPGETGIWDRRYRITLQAAENTPRAGEFEIRPLGMDRPPDDGLITPVPACARPALPALWQGRRLLAVPHLNWRSPQTPSLWLKAALLPTEGLDFSAKYII